MLDTRLVLSARIVLLSFSTLLREPHKWYVVCAFFPVVCDIECLFLQALQAIQALGGNGYINDYPAGRILRSGGC